MRSHCSPISKPHMTPVRAPDKRSNRDNSEIIFHISPYTHICDPSSEPSHRDGSNEGSQHMFSLGNKKNYL